MYFFSQHFLERSPSHPVSYRTGASLCTCGGSGWWGAEICAGVLLVLLLSPYRHPCYSTSTTATTATYYYYNGALYNGALRKKNEHKYFCRRKWQKMQKNMWKMRKHICSYFMESLFATFVDFSHFLTILPVQRPVITGPFITGPFANSFEQKNLFAKKWQKCKDMWKNEKIHFVIFLLKKNMFLRFHGVWLL